MTTLKRIAVAGVIGAATVLGVAPASADTILTFGQSASDAITATEPSTGVTNISATDAAITVDLIDTAPGAPIPTPFAALFSLNATSTDAATLSGVVIQQDYTGTFCIASLAGCTGTVYLRGSFTELTVGFNGGAQFSMNAAQPPGTLSFASNVISLLGAPTGMTLSSTNVTPALHIVDNTIAPFTSNISGTFSATTTLETPEPTTLGLLGIALAGLGFAQRRKRA